MDPRSSGWRQPLISIALAALAGGCSADVSRFDFPSSLSLNDSSSGATGTIPAPTEPVKERSHLLGAETPENSTGQAYYPPPAPRRDNGISVSALPDATPPPAPAPSQTYAAAPPAQAPAPPAWNVDGREPQQPAPVAAAPITNPSAPAYSDRGEMIEVRPGDTLYGLSKRHRVSLTELMQTNDLKGPNLKPGQKLYLPGSRAGAAAETTKPAPAEVAAVPVEAPAEWTGSYVVKPGESLYAIARQNGIKPAELQKYNGITDVRRMKPGTVLKMPAGVGTQVAASTATQTDAWADPAAPRVVQTPPVQPTILNSQRPDAGGKQTVAVNTPSSATPVVPPQATPAAVDSGKLRWPAQGKIIAGFGQRPDGTHNDGVNLAVPMGTEVHAADTGVVAYAGNELKGYGNLILLRHDNGWVTAYAHSEELLVKRGDKIKRGQVIAKAGKTGQVDQPQVHFELRQGQRPVDPVPYMEKL